jgi:hypothetical protein
MKRTEVVMPTTIKASPREVWRVVWRVAGPWGTREFAASPPEPTPAARLATELGLPRSTSLEDVRRAVANKSWDAEGECWVDDAAP